MTEKDLLSWALERYFDGWEVERAERIFEKQGMIMAVKYLRDRAMESLRGFAGPDMPGYDTRAGKVLVWCGSRSHGEPDLVMTLEKFAHMKLALIYQPKLL